MKIPPRPKKKLKSLKDRLTQSTKRSIARQERQGIPNQFVDFKKWMQDKKAAVEKYKKEKEERLRNKDKTE